MISFKHPARTRILKRISKRISGQIFGTLLLALFAAQSCASSDSPKNQQNGAAADTVYHSLDSLKVQVLQGDSLDVSLRGLSVVDDSVAWVSGSLGSVAFTSNKGEEWTWLRLPEAYQEIDFRDIEAFSA